MSTNLYEKHAEFQNKLDLASSPQHSHFAASRAGRHGNNDDDNLHRTHPKRCESERAGSSQQHHTSKRVGARTAMMSTTRAMRRALRRQYICLHAAHESVHAHDTTRRKTHRTPAAPARILRACSSAQAHTSAPELLAVISDSTKLARLGLNLLQGHAALDSLICATTNAEVTTQTATELRRPHRCCRASGLRSHRLCAAAP